MGRPDVVGAGDRAGFRAAFSADWLLGQAVVGKVWPRRWKTLHGRMLARAARGEEGRVYPVERRAGLTPEQFRDEYFVTGKPVVLEGAASGWPAVGKWTPEYLIDRCGTDEVAVLDGQHWTVNRDLGKEVVSTVETKVPMRELIGNVAKGGAWYGAFLELLDKYEDLRDDLDFSFVHKYGHTNPRLPWQRDVLAKMYVGGPGTATSFHCAGISNLYAEIYGRKKWVLVPPEFTPFMYPASSRGINWQSRVDFRNPDYDGCPLYRFADRYETVLEAGDVLWNPPFVWHGVANLTETIAVSLWWTNLTRSFSSNFLFSTLSALGRPNPIAIQLGLTRETDETQSSFRVHLNK